jgi:Putative bacterial sensory transduction regulator
MRSFLATIAVVAIALVTLAPCFGQSSPELFTTLKPEDVAGILRDAGYRAVFVRSGMAGYNVYVYPYGCQEGRCASLQFSLGLTKNADFTLSMVNKWNQEKRFAKAYLDTNGNLYLESDVYFDGGVTKDTVTAWARLYDSLVGDFRQMMNQLGKK